MACIQFDRLSSILCLGAHADDIEIGCGASLLGWLDKNPELRVTWVVFSGAGVRQREATDSAQAYLSGHAGCQITIQQFPDAYFPAHWEAIKQYFAQLSQTVRADLVLTHRLEDRHQDHRVISELTWNAFRSSLILEYEIPKYEGDLGLPNVYMPVDRDLAERKLELLHRCFPTQASKDWFDRETFQGLMRLRGLECRSPSGLAEAFYARKLVLSADRSVAGISYAE